MPRLGPYELKNPWVLAPMAGVSERPFRVLAFKMGAALCPTELVSAQGLFRANARSLKYLRYDKEVEVPYSLQVFGGEPDVMAKAAVIGKEWGAQIIDINMGCPVKKVTRSGAGSALLCDAPRAAEIVRQIREATGLPVTAKIRSGWDAHQKNYLEMADALGAAGIVGLAVHPRTRAQGYSGSADWAVISDLKRHVGNRFTVIGNGDVKTVADARRMQEQTGCDLVMIGRGALGNPWLFRELNGGEKPTRLERYTTVRDHFRAHLQFVIEGDELIVARAGGASAHEKRRGGEPKTEEERRAHSALTAVRSFRKHAAWYAHGLFGASAFRDLINRLDGVAEVEAALERFFLGADVDETAANDEQTDVDYRQALG